MPPISPQAPLQPPTCLLCQVCPRPICQALSSFGHGLTTLAGSLGRVVFASQSTGSLHTIGFALQKGTRPKTCPFGVARLSLPRAGFILVGVFGGRPSLPLTTRAVMLFAIGRNIRASTKGVLCSSVSVHTGHSLAVDRHRLFNSPLPSPLPSTFLVPASCGLPTPCLMPATTPSAPQGGLPSVPNAGAWCSPSTVSRVASFRWSL